MRESIRLKRDEIKGRGREGERETCPQQLLSSDFSSYPVEVWYSLLLREIGGSESIKSKYPIL